MILRKHIIIFFLFAVIKNYGQSKRVADRYFDEFSYAKSAKLYEALIVKKGDTTKHTLSRLADSYYNNTDTERAEVWYEKLALSYKNKLEDKFLFRYAQVLRSNGKYKKSDSIFLTLKSSSNNNRKTEIKKENYLLNYSNQNIRIGVRNLAINTIYSDFGGFLLNGKSYFTSAVPKGVKKEKIYKWNNQPFLNIYKASEQINVLEESVKDTILTLVNPNLIEVPISSDFHESTPVFTKDGKTIYFTRNNVNGKKVRRDKKNTSNLKIYKASFVNGFWVNVKELPFNNDEYSVGHPALSLDEKTLYFVSNMPGGFGATDIYKVNILKEDKYSEPINLGEKINTPEKEMFPFIGTDNVLYFSSNGHLGFGLLDIFQSKINDEESFSIPKNLGEPFNSNRDDFSFYIGQKGKKGFFSSNRKGGKGDDDIYSFYLYTDSPICKGSIQGVITDTNKDSPIDGAIVKLIDTNGLIVKQTVTDKTGKYVFKNVLCEKYKLTSSKLDHKLLETKQVIITKEKSIKINLNLIPLIVDNQIVINPIYFDYNKSIIREDAQYELEKIITVMNNHPEVIIKIESHTDSRGKSDYNRKLSDKRAKSTRAYILSRGISKLRIESAIGYGEDQLLNDCNDKNNKKCSEIEHQKNRRSYFYIVKGIEKIKARQTAEKVLLKKKVLQKSIPKKSTFLQFLKKNFKGSRSSKPGSNKCMKDEENCNKDKKDFKIDYKN